MSTIFFKPDGSRCTRETTQAIIKEAKAAEKPDPYTLFAYQGERVRASVVTHKWITVPAHMPTEHWKRYGVVVHNVVATDYEGRPLKAIEYRPDTQATQDFRSLDEANAYYIDFLTQYTGSRLNEAGELVVKGNTLPKNKDAPTVDEDDPDAESVGCW